MPCGQESELMGIYIFAGQILAWLPPLIFTAMNEAGVSMRWGLFSDAMFFLIALVISYNMGVRSTQGFV
jgi:MFS-type transporter involved in bile tolerance (Atg22 family)